MHRHYLTIQKIIWIHARLKCRKKFLQLTPQPNANTCCANILHKSHLTGHHVLSSWTGSAHHFN